MGDLIQQLSNVKKQSEKKKLEIYINTIKNIKNYDEDELKDILTNLDISFKNKSEREEEYNEHKNKNYKSYPDFDDEDFYKKIYQKKEFYQNQIEKYDENDEDLTNKLCNSKFKLLSHQIFLKNYMSINTPYNGVLLFHGTGTGKCEKIDTPIIMYDGTIKMVQDIEIGEYIMGDDSTPRKVLSLARGEDEMYEISQVKGDTYTVNSEHILSLKATNQGIEYIKTI